MVKYDTCAILNLTANNAALYPLTYNRPIAALPFAGRYRLIDFMLSPLSYAHIASVALFIGDSGRSIYDHVRSGKDWKLDSRIRGGIFTFSQQNWKARHHHENQIEDYYYNHRIFLERSRCQYVLVAGTKIIANVNFRNLKSAHIESGKDISLVYADSHPDLFGKDHPNERFLDIDTKGQVKKLLKKSQLSETHYTYPVSLNMFLLSTDLLRDLIDQARARGEYMEVDELVQAHLMDYSINLFKHESYIANINHLMAYYQANVDMLNYQNFKDLFHSDQPVLTKTKNGVPSYYHERSFVRNAIVGTGCKMFGEVLDSVINRRVLVGENARVTHSVILQGAQIGEGAVVEYAILDKGAQIAPGAIIRGTKEQIKIIGKNHFVDAKIH